MINFVVVGQNGPVTEHNDTHADAGATVAPDSSYLCGAWGGSGPRLAVVNPADGSTAAEVATVTPTEVAETLDAAASALQSWRDTDPWARSQHLRDAAAYIRDHLADIAASVTAEQGKPLAQAEGEVAGAADQFDWCADEARRIYGRVIPARGAGRRLLVQREPVGVVGAFAPSNFPALLPARKMAAATAAGCTIIVKPAEETPTAALWLARAAEAAGIPAGVINVLVGDPAMISEMILGDSRVRKVTLTGSVPLGSHIMEEASKQLKSVSLELGGHSPVIVLD
ncbi:MAG: aldehyde dehydrogenase family protein, partial [Acidimicrobiaceae bacterium]|nr:aldehyde dehydrogenase family protein [Acidimicrobiaceae bacterium]